ncbi:MAG: PD40 domain-containing protein [Desulfamplus sp.]|nr:PD40 domain-containing protein [Desulfamplus sp.]
MNNYDKWDWDIGTKKIADFGSWKDMFSYIEEFRVSPDGEKVAAIVKNDDMEFTVCIQREGNEPETWENSYDKVWNLRFGPDGRLSALVSDTGEWKVSTDDNPWDNGYDFVWNMVFNSNGQIAVSAQKDLSYCVVNDQIPWENEFSRLTQMILSPDSQKTAAVVEAVHVLESEIFKFRQGCYSVAVNGEVWNRNFMNVWNPSFSSDSRHVAASVRTSYGEYYIAVNGKTWNTSFSSVWEPRFSPSPALIAADTHLHNHSAETHLQNHPAEPHIHSYPTDTHLHGYSVTAPVKKGGKWFLAKDGEIFWDRPYVQLWNHCYSPDGRKIAAIVAPEFGRWTMVLDNIPWEITFSDYVSDPVFSPDGNRIACLFKDKGKWGIAVDGNAWNGLFDMVYPPVFSPNSSEIAVKIKKDGFYYIALNGTTLNKKYEVLENPLFSPDSSAILTRGGHGESYNREVISLKRP